MRRKPRNCCPSASPPFSIAAQPAFAYDSSANFDLTKEITLVGAVKEVQFKNPDVWLQVLAFGGMKVANAGVETSRPVYEEC